MIVLMIRVFPEMPFQKESYSYGIDHFFALPVPERILGLHGHLIFLLEMPFTIKNIETNLHDHTSYSVRSNTNSYE
jgi:hypothetical protein